MTLSLGGKEALDPSSPLEPEQDPEGPEDWARFEAHRSFVHVFGNPHRALGFAGELHPDPKARRLESLRVRCVGPVHPDTGPALSTGFEDRAAGSGWTHAAGDADPPRWTRSGFETRLTRSPERGASTREGPTHQSPAHEGPAYKSTVWLEFDWTWGHAPPDLERRLARKLDPFIPREVKAASTPLEHRVDPEHWGPACTPEQAAQAVSGLRLGVYSGAGLSQPSGIAPFCGAGSLDDVLHFEDPFLGRVVDTALLEPNLLLGCLRDFQWAFVTARPNPAHHSLAQLEAAGQLNFVATSNFDTLHPQSGSRLVQRQHALKWALEHLEMVPCHALLVLGLAFDEDHIVRRCRQRGVQVVVFDRVRPHYLSPGDLWVRGSLERTVPAFVSAFLVGVSGSLR